MTGALGDGDDKPRMTLGRQRKTRPAVFESELRLARYEGYLLFPDGLPVARIALKADHIEKRGVPRQPAFVEANPETTLWHRPLEAAPKEEPDSAVPSPSEEPVVEKPKARKKPTAPPPADDGGPI